MATPSCSLITETIDEADARREFSQLLDQVARRERRVIVEKHGTPIAAIISAADLARE